MKKIILLVAALGTATIGYAQKALLSLNEQNQYIFFEVKQVAATPDAASLAGYIKANIAGIKTVEQEKGNGNIAGKGAFIVYKQGLITGQEEGQISYNLSLDFKDNKYRLLLTGFEYTPYQRNRYGVFAPANGIHIPLEKTDGKISTKQLNTYLDKLGAYSAKISKQLNDYITNPARVKVHPEGLKKVDTKNWE
jgi:hypothetical protein